jgi:hypothetical protein
MSWRDKIDVDRPGRKGTYVDPFFSGASSPTLDGYSAIKELWATPEGRIFYQLTNWSGFWKCVPLMNGSDKVHRLPAHAVQVMKDGEWLIPLPVPL